MCHPNLCIVTTTSPHCNGYVYYFYDTDLTERGIPTELNKQRDPEKYASTI